ncbi:MAG: helix-turn-helix transcriptional regulator [Planctomycetes bacterium]|nr:helix-turn-helix transcriptional regulator [Planctomycetota bacterium]
MRRAATETMSEALKKALGAADESLRGIARATGVCQPCLSRFLAGQGTLRLDSADRLARHFGIRVVGPEGPELRRRGGSGAPNAGNGGTA